LIGSISKYIWWIPLCWSVVDFIKQEFIQGVTTLLVSLLLLIAWRGKESFSEKLNAKADSNDIICIVKRKEVMWTLSKKG